MGANYSQLVMLLRSGIHPRLQPLHFQPDSDETLTLDTDEILEQFRKMRARGVLTDSKLQTGSESFDVHMVVLAAASLHFEKRFFNVRDRRKYKTLNVPVTCRKVMPQILDSFYGAPLRVEWETLPDLLTAGRVLECEAVADQCSDFVARQVNPTNAIGRMRFLVERRVRVLVEQVNRFIRLHFVQVSRAGEFLHLSGAEVFELIRRDDINVIEESDVYNAVAAWVGANEDRRDFMIHLLREVRCQFLSPRFLERQMETELVRNAPYCLSHLQGILQDLRQHVPPAVRERTPFTRRVIYVTGGCDVGFDNTAMAYDVDERSWTRLPDKLHRRSFVRGAFLGGKFYVMGHDLASGGIGAERYDPQADRWETLTSMTFESLIPGVAAMDGYLYVVGVEPPGVPRVDRYDPDADAWTSLKEMTVKRSEVGVAVVNRMLYAVGGYSGTCAVADVECYHPERDEWSPRSPMKFPRSSAGVAALGDYIYVAGGMQGQTRLHEVERYDTRSDTWTTVKPMRVRRSGLSLTAVGGKLYAVGGFFATTITVDRMEIYDPQKDAWVEGPIMPSRRGEHAAGFNYQQCAVHRG